MVDMRSSTEFEFRRPMYQRSSCLNSDPTGRSVRLSRPLGSIVAVCNGVAGVRPGRAFAALFQYAF